MKILSFWQHETGKWDEVLRIYTERKKSPIKTKELEVNIVKSDFNNKKIVKFYGGPTGHESYYLDDLLRTKFNKKEDRFCICAGTINSWSCCWVRASDLLRFLKEAKNEKD
jgi:hypothetical protein